MNFLNTIKSTALISIAALPLNVNASSKDDKIIGCWQAIKGDKSVMCFKEENNHFYINIEKSTINGKWQRNGDTLDISIFGNKISFTSISLSDTEHKYTNSRDSEIGIDKRVPFQAPTIPYKKTAKFSSPKKEVASDIVDVLAQQNQISVTKIKNDLLVKGPHCKGAENVKKAVIDQLGQTNITDHSSLTNKLFTQVCKVHQDNKIKIDKPFISALTFYSGAKKIGDWPCETSNNSEKTDTFSVFGIFLSKNQVSRWHVVNNEKVDVWLAPFATAPSDSLKFTYIYNNKDWQVESVCSSSRL